MSLEAPTERMAASLAQLGADPLLAALAASLATLVLFALVLLRRVALLRRLEDTQEPTSPKESAGKGGASAGTLIAPGAPKASESLEAVVDEYAAGAASDVQLDVTTIVAERPIGSGGQGGVWLAHDPSSGKRCALKQLRKGRLAALKKVGNVKKETCQWLIERDALLQCGHHPFVTTCYATFQDDQSLFFALELASGGELTAAAPSPPRHARACPRARPPHPHRARCTVRCTCIGGAVGTFVLPECIPTACASLSHL